MKDCQVKGTVSTIVKIMFDDSSLSNFDKKEETIKIDYEAIRETYISENRQVESVSINDVSPAWILQAIGEDKIKQLCLQLMEY